MKCDNGRIVGVAFVLAIPEIQKGSSPGHLQPAQSGERSHCFVDAWCPRCTDGGVHSDP